MNIPVVKVPTFTMTLPVSGETINFRPFLVKEEKILLLAKEADTLEAAITAIADTVDTCTFNKMKVDDYCLADTQYAFLQIRGKSVGGEIELFLVCGECDHKHTSTISITDFTVDTTSKTKTLIDVDNVVKVELSYPKIQHYISLFETSNDDAVYDVVVECIKKIYTDDEMFVNTKETYGDVRTFIDNLTPDQFEKFEQFFIHMPILNKKIEFTCGGCEKSNTLTIDSITNFFG